MLDVGAFLLAISFVLLPISARNDPHQLPLHLLDFPSEVGQLTRDSRYVLAGCHGGRILTPNPLRFAGGKVRFLCRVTRRVEMFGSDP